jgi:hypothetical protein
MATAKIAHKQIAPVVEGQPQWIADWKGDSPVDEHARLGLRIGMADSSNG